MVRKSLAAEEQQAHSSDNQARCSDKLQRLGFPNPRQLVAARTILVAASAPCLNQPNHKSQGKIYYSQAEPTRPSETLTQHQGITKPSLFVVVDSNLDAASTHSFH